MVRKDNITAPKERQATAPLRGYAYQLYQSALAWANLKKNERLYLEVAEDFSVLARGELQATQVKNKKARININTKDVVQTIDSLVTLTKANSELDISIRYLTTAKIGREQKKEHRVGNKPTLEAWKNLAEGGDVAELRKVLGISKVSPFSKDYFKMLTDDQFRQQVLSKLHFDCDAPELDSLRSQLQTRLRKLVAKYGGGRDNMMRLERAMISRILLLCTQQSGERVLSPDDLTDEIKEATHSPISQSVLDQMSAIIAAISLPESATAINQAIDRSVTLHELPPRPLQYIERQGLTESLQGIVKKYGFGWLYGAIGTGKTTLAREYGQATGEKWVSINLSGMDRDQATITLGKAADLLKTAKVEGLIVDDIDHKINQAEVDAIHKLAFAAQRLSMPLIFTCSSPAPHNVRSLLGANEDLSLQIPDFSEPEVGVLVEKSGGKPDLWKRYIFTASGGGHPQLSHALISNLQQRGWPSEEFDTLEALIEGNPAVKEVRAASQNRLLEKIEPDARSLLQRLSLQAGNFTRSFAIDLAAVIPPISDAGLLLNTLIGPWIDQMGKDHFRLSPLLSDLAATSLSPKVQKTIHYAIADSLTQGPDLDASKMNTAVLSALVSGNEEALTKFCIGILGPQDLDIKGIALAASMVCIMNSEKPTCPQNPRLSQMFRGVQLLLHHYGPPGRGGFDKLLERFRAESADAQVDEPIIASGMELFIYFKLLATSVQPKPVPDFMPLIQRIHEISSNPAFQEEFEFESIAGESGPSIAGLLLFLQAGQLEKIDDLEGVFKFLDESKPELRSALLQTLVVPGFDASFLVQGAWLAEETAKTIKAERHASTFERLEKMAVNWGQADLAISCLRLRAVTLDENGERGQEALAALDAGIAQYGASAELLRAKSTVLRRADDHLGSLAIADELIKKEAISNPIDRAFLGRNAAVSAENLGEYDKARQHYLYGRSAAQQASTPEMRTMATGLLGDAALAAWHDGDASTCLADLKQLLDEIKDLDISSSLRAAHVKAFTGHILSWLMSDSSRKNRKLGDDKPNQISPGIVSHPEPHERIAEHTKAPVDLNWYMLAIIECNSNVDAGILNNLDALLPNGRFREGEWILVEPVMCRALSRLDADSFIDALSTRMRIHLYVKSQDSQTGLFDVENLNYETPQPLTRQQGLQAQGISQPAALTFCAACLLARNIDAFDEFVERLEKSGVVITDTAIIASLRTGHKSNGDFFGNVAHAFGIERQRIGRDDAPDPTDQCNLMLGIIRVASMVNLLADISEIALRSYREDWKQILQFQSFRLVDPIVHAEKISELLKKDGGDPAKNLNELVLATLPATKISYQQQARDLLAEAFTIRSSKNAE